VDVRDLLGGITVGDQWPDQGGVVLSRELCLIRDVVVQKSVLLKVSETPSLKLAPGASVLPDVDVEPDAGVGPDVPPHAARTIARMTPSAASACRRLGNFAFMVVTSRVSD